MDEEITGTVQATPEPAGMELESSAPVDRLEISPDLLKAYASNLGKMLFLFAVIIGGYFLAIRFVGTDPFVGMLGEVTESLEPTGVVRVAGESWQAKSVEGQIDIGEEVEVLAIYHLKLEVKRKILE